MILPAIATVEEKSADEVVLILDVPRGHSAFAGHFPTRPILPGVVQIDWAVRLGDTFLHTGQTVATDFQVKFSKLFEPGPNLILRLKLDRARASLVFEYCAGDQPVSSGRIKLTGAP
ncbi:MAG TPA: hypothetical protein VGG27_20535 [Magnetospirillaceae bacterium]